MAQALAEAEGYSACHLVEIEFGSVVTASNLEWTVTPAGNSQYVECQVSLDSGRNWARVVGNAAGGDAAIPGLEAGVVTTNKELLVRFLISQSTVAGARADIRISGCRVVVNFADGSEIDHTFDLSEGIYVGTEYATDGIRQQNEIALDLNNVTGARLEWANSAPYDGDSNAQGINVSTGILANENPTAPRRQDPNADATERRALAAFSIEFLCWLRASSGTAATLCEWESAANDVVFRLSVDSSNRLVLFITENQFFGLPASGWTLQSADGVYRRVQWQHVAVVYDGYWVQTFVDGRVLGRWPLPTFMDRDQSRYGIVVPTDGPLRFGVATAANNFQLAEVRVWNRALRAGVLKTRRTRKLSDSEIEVLNEDEGLVAYVPLDNPAGGSNPVNRVALVLSDATYPAPTVREYGPAPTRAAYEITLPWRGLAPQVAGSFEVVGPRPGYVTAPLSLAVAGDVLQLTDAPRDVEYGGKTFEGIGQLGQIEAIEENTTALPTQLRLSLSGVQTANIALALGEEYLDRPVRVYWALVDTEAGTLVADPVLIFEGRLDSMSISMGETATVAVEATSHLANWERSGAVRWNEATQQERYPEDKGLEFIAQMADREVWWPARVGGTT
jgi:hypothetical protein